MIFGFQLSRAREGPKQFLGNFNGILQIDGYSGYDRVGGPKLIHAGYWAQARRYFFQAVEAHPVLAVIEPLYTEPSTAVLRRADNTDPIMTKVDQVTANLVSA